MEPPWDSPRLGWRSGHNNVLITAILRSDLSPKLFTGCPAAPFRLICSYFSSLGPSVRPWRCVAVCPPGLQAVETFTCGLKDPAFLRWKELVGIEAVGYVLCLPAQVGQAERVSNKQGVHPTFLGLGLLY